MIVRLLKNFSQFPLEKRILIIFGVTGLLFSALSVGINVFLDLDILLIVATVLAGICSYAVLYATDKSDNHTKISFTIMVFLILFLHPSLWLFNGGSTGPTVFFMFFNAILIAILIRKRRRIIFLMGIQVLSLLMLLYVEHTFPSLIYGYSTGFSRAFDIYSSFILVFICSLFVVMRVMKEYNKTIYKLEMMHLEHIRTNEKLKIASETDELTGLYNRRYMMQMLKSIVQSDTDSRETTIVMVDIDHFKSINDTYGHGFGDDVLKRVSGELKNSMRGQGSVGRIGGEEFLVILPKTSEYAALEKAEALCRQISELNWREKNFVVTISGGVYALKGDETLDEALDKVDVALYEAKNTGRNKIVCIDTDRRALDN